VPGPGAIVHVGVTGSCIHGGQISVVAANRVLVNGQPVGTVADGYPIVGCPFQVPVPGGTKPQPCVRAQWTVPAARVSTMGKFLVTQASTGVTLSIEQIPQGSPAMTAVQPRVVAM
jgi:hypothetical protein